MNRAEQMRALRALVARSTLDDDTPPGEHMALLSAVHVLYPELDLSDLGDGATCERAARLPCPPVPGFRSRLCDSEPRLRRTEQSDL